MLAKIETYIQKHTLLKPNYKIIVGVSGGADSVALLRILISLGYECIIAHCNFHLRNTESDRDENFVRTLAKTLNIEYYSIDFMTIEYSKSKKISIEMAARDLRYEWFEELRVKLNADAIAIAHHADDNVETLLMNLVRGTGIRGMNGIPCKNGFVVRPLLCCSRKEIISYLEISNQEFVTDSTNACSDYTRNKFRNQVIPLLKEINPSVQNTLIQTIQRFEDIEGIYREAITNKTQELAQTYENTTKISIDLLKKEKYKTTVLFEILSQYGFNFSTASDIINTLGNNPGQFFYSAEYTLLHDRNFLIISPKIVNNSIEFLIEENTEYINSPIELAISTLKRTSNFKISKESSVAHFDASKLQFPLLLRKWVEGDVFTPFGMTKNKKISDFFIDNKFSRFEKENCWLLSSNNKIIWVVGHRTNNTTAITNSTQDIIEITIIH